MFAAGLHFHLSDPADLVAELERLADDPLARRASRDFRPAAHVPIVSCLCTIKAHA